MLDQSSAKTDERRTGDDERGKPDRRPVEIPGTATLENGSTVVVVVFNLSYDGCAVETQQPLEPGTTIELRTRIGRVIAEVRWGTATQAGLHFNAYSAARVTNGVGHAPRESVPLIATIRRFGRGSFAVPISEMSESGCAMDFVDRPEVGEAITIKFEGLHSVDATVGWTAGTGCSAQFANPLYPAVLELLLHGRPRGHAHLS